jgi:hypothetical protein
MYASLRIPDHTTQVIDFGQRLQRGWVLTATALSFVLMLVNFFQAVHL